MPDQSESIAEQTAPEAESTEEPKKRRGPRKEAEVRAEVEAEKNAEIEALNAEIEALKAEALKAKAAEIERKAADRGSPAAAFFEDGPAPEIAQGSKDAPGAITVHFVADGLTMLGKVWYRGEELTVVPDTDEYAEAAPTLSMDEYEQENLWGRQFFRPGPWRGKKFAEISDADLAGMSDEAKADVLAAAAKARASS